MTLANESRDTNVVEGLVITETGLPGVLFSMLDTETDSQLIKEIHDTLTSMLQVLAANNLSPWLSLCKDVLTVATGIYAHFIMLATYRDYESFSWLSY